LCDAANTCQRGVPRLSLAAHSRICRGALDKGPNWLKSRSPGG
jgi:hypothetical protein